ncbi:hypothetical protein GP486_002676 [Trichoglossum hirsutum]|uniref:Uncharacterized protein n=1 Tax=Trichoglossum hirsutum TaxID=265104 RepID=A0A9P8RRW2_9PEZI|nr:hypothetical protein GP486_002676 [Trichoglossum hirsutum]
MKGTICIAAVLVLFERFVHASNPLGIDLDPAPPPEEGPPLSRNALRNKKYLPAEIGGIVGAYVLTVSVLGLLWLFIGRPRRQRSGFASFRDVEMVSGLPTSPSKETKFWEFRKPWQSSSTTSPKEPKHWDFRKPWSNPTSPVKDSKQSLASPTQGSVATFDEQVIEEDRRRRAEDMDRLYAAVMAHDDARSKVTLSESNPQSPSRLEPDSKSPMPSPSLPKVSSPLASPRSVPRPPSVASKHSRTGSVASNGSKRRGIRGLPISNPIHIPSYSQFMSNQASPRSNRSGRTGSINSPMSARRKSDEEPLTPQRIDEDPIQGNRIDEEAQSFASGRRSPSLPLRDNLSARNDSRTKVTILERAIADPKSPRTGVPMTPYSPYMPYTPITPVSPRLVTKAERKAREKEEARVVKELTKSNKELFDSAY